LVIYDLFRKNLKSVFEDKKTVGEHKIAVNMQDMPAGVYLA
jgi:hypothetical protein